MWPSPAQAPKWRGSLVSTRWMSAIALTGSSRRKKAVARRCQASAHSAQRQHPVEELDGERKLLRLQRLLGAAHQQIGGVAAGARPAPLDQVRDAVRLALVLGSGKPREKLVEGGGLARLCGLGLGFRIGGLGLRERRSRRARRELRQAEKHGGACRYSMGPGRAVNSRFGRRVPDPPLGRAQRGGEPRSIDLSLVGDDLAVVRQAPGRDKIDLALELGDACSVAPTAPSGRRSAMRSRPAASSHRSRRRGSRSGAGAPSSGWRRAISATCSGRTNMPLTFVVWSARPIQPLMRRLVRPHGLGPGSTAERSPSARRISGCADRAGDDDLADLALGDRIARARPHDLDDQVLVDDHALARAGLIGDDAHIGGGVGLVGVDAARGDVLLQRFGKAAPEASAFLMQEASRPAFAAASSRILRKSGVPQ